MNRAHGVPQEHTCVQTVRGRTKTFVKQIEPLRYRHRSIDTQVGLQPRTGIEQQGIGMAEQRRMKRSTASARQRRLFRQLLLQLCKILSWYNVTSTTPCLSQRRNANNL